ncbi:unnamed protein product [Kuraishia capsulata CBS 1993]|uniref:Uncharacterized protein n=1 Tax=Kuraishia capsulata CBS 1993 TaxID=1382522 RepID=W6MXZ6_9ASCO|nr:uncharacterized protein KUCA_T00005743001 [Kuraishia capsulata CBS 1993]CDK29750.1 unnamed protein product [Kuraishia capsulata CBS 1993]
MSRQSEQIVYRHPSSILTGVTGVGDQDGELTRISLKSIIATKYIVQNEFLLELIKGSDKDFSGAADAAKKVAELKSNLAALRASYDSTPFNVATDESLQELALLDRYLSSLEREFSNPHGDDEESQKLVKKNEKLLEKFQKKHNVLVYEVSGNLAGPENLNAGQESEDEEVRGSAMDVDTPVSEEDPAGVAEISGSYYRVSGPLKFSGVQYQSVSAAEFRRRAEQMKANTSVICTEQKQVGQIEVGQSLQEVIPGDR